MAPPKQHTATGTNIYDEGTASEIERSYMERVASKGSRGPGAEGRVARAKQFLSEGESQREGFETPALLITREAKKWLELGDEYFPVALLVAAVANKVADATVWLMIIAPPSSGKTELLVALASRKDARILSSITPKTFASGMKPKTEDAGDKKKDPSLLVRLQANGQWLVALKDFGTMSSLPWEKQAQIYGQLREIYDGKYNAAWGTGAELEWDGKIAVIAAATENIDRGKTLRTSLGERFIQFRPLPANPSRVAEKARVIAKTPDGSKRMKKALRHAYKKAFAQAVLRAEILSEDSESEATELRAVAVAELLAEARREVYRRDGPYGSSFEVAAPEGPARLTKIFMSLSEACQVCFGSNRDAAFHLLVRFAMDSVTPGQRGRLLLMLAGVEHGVTVQQAAKKLRCDDNTARRHLDDLLHIGLADSEELGKTALYTPSKKLAGYAARIFPDESESSTALTKLSHCPTILPPERERERRVSDNQPEEAQENRGDVHEGEGA